MLENIQNFVNTKISGKSNEYKKTLIESIFKWISMVFRLDYDFFVERETIYIKPAISEGKILSDNDFSDKILLIYLYAFSFY